MLKKSIKILIKELKKNICNSGNWTYGVSFAGIILIIIFAVLGCMPTGKFKH